MGESKSYKILFIAPYPFGRVASQRFRFEQYWDTIAAQHQPHFQSFFSESAFRILYRKGFILSKTFAVVKGFIRRLVLLLQISNYDIIFIHREATPLGVPLIEWVIAKIYRKPIVYDFDDAIWLPNTSSENKFVALFKCHWKTKYLCKWAWKITCGNDFLCDYAKQFHSNVLFLPTTLDTKKVPATNRELETNNHQQPPTIGWTGTHSTLKYLHSLLPVLQDLEKEIAFRFVVIADKNPVLRLKNHEFILWQKETEWKDLAQVDIGLMPLGQDVWAEGKCGFKILQYMALAIPALASPTKVNQKIILDGSNGFICQTKEEWKRNILELVKNISLREKMGKLGNETLRENYSKERWEAFYLKLFVL